MYWVMWLLSLLAVSPAVNAADQGSPQIQKPQLRPLTLRKCFCGAGEAWDGSKCVALDKTPVPLLNKRNSVDYINTAEFAHVTTGKITCNGSTEIVYKGAFNESANSSLSFLGHMGKVNNYCVEHTPGFEVHVCLLAPSIPRCCPPGHVLEGDFSCVPLAGTNFTPPIILPDGSNNKPLQFPDTNLGGAVKDVSCDGLAKPYRVDLSSGSGVLIYNVKAVALNWFPPSEYDQVKERTTSYCVGVERGKSLNDVKYVAKTCHTDLAELHRHTCANATCIRKCCPDNMVFTGNKKKNYCLQVDGSTEIWHQSLHWNQTELPTDLAVVHGKPLCKNPFRTNSEHHLQADGTLHVSTVGTFAADRYCVELHVSNEKVALICPSEELTECQWKHVVVLVLLSISCLFLLATLVIYLSVAELRDRTNGRCLISLVSAMIATYVSILINQESRSTSDEECYATGFVGHVCTLATFFWLNVMCFDMWSTFRSSTQKYQSMKVFVFYSIYAWGSPLLVGIVGLVLDLVKPPGVIRPGFVTSRCWFDGQKELWSYVSGIILLLMFANLFFFIHVAVTLVMKLKQRQAAFQNKESRASNANNRGREQILLFVRLFIVMGVSWITEILSTSHRGTCNYWVLTDILNSLQGVLIFVVSVCNKDNIKKIKNAWLKRIMALRGRDQAWNLNQSRQASDFSMVTSEASRKASLISIPCRTSTSSAGCALNTSNNNRRLSDQGPDSATRAAGHSGPFSQIEMTPMATVNE